MDLKAYYQYIRDTEAQIPDEYPVIVSRPTGDGGRGGIRTQVSRSLASKMIAEDKARLATEQETAEFLDSIHKDRRIAQETAAAERLQVTIVTDSDGKVVKTSSRSQKNQ